MHLLEGTNFILTAALNQVWTPVIQDQSCLLFCLWSIVVWFRSDFDLLHLIDSATKIDILTVLMVDGPNILTLCP